MTAQKGKDLLLKVDTDGAGDFTTVAGLRARSLAFNAATVDVTDQESAALAGAAGGRGHQDRADHRERHL
jgi:TP901-1 family phage major tail protein